MKIIWRGGRPFKPAIATPPTAKKANGTSNAVISLDPDDEGESASTFVDKPEFEDEEEESIGHSDEPVTPSPPRRMPSRKARVKSFKEMVEYEGLSEEELDSTKLDDGEADNGLEWGGFEE